MLFTNQNILLTPIEYLKGVGPYKGDLLRKEIALDTFGDMLQFYPFRYIDRSNLMQIKNIQEDGTMVQLIGKINFSEVINNGKTRRLVANLKDATGMIELVWFQGIHSIEQMIKEPGIFLVYGKAVRFNGYWTINHPEIDKLETASQDELPAYMPVYSSTEKLKNKWLSGRNYVKLVQQLFSQIKEKDIPENLPESVMISQRLLSRFEANKNIHFPEDPVKLQAAIHRLKFEELFIHQIGICKLKLNRHFIQGYQFMKVGDVFNTFYKNHMPFDLTEDQKEVLREIRLDTQTGKQMNRLLQGDVGSGKTIVALLCMLLAIDNDFQACMMAPTEILAQQHYVGIGDLLKEMNIEVGFLTGKVKAKDRKILLSKLENGEIKILIGTHALIEDTVVFKNLGLCIIDEQPNSGKKIHYHLIFWS
jgi:ATP-dependent DNA helicase RecG